MRRLARWVERPPEQVGDAAASIPPASLLSTLIPSGLLVSVSICAGWVLAGCGPAPFEPDGASSIRDARADHADAAATADGSADAGHAPLDAGAVADGGPRCVLEPPPAIPGEIVARLEGQSENDRMSCADALGSLGPERWYPLSVSERTGLELTVQARFTVGLSIRTDCADPLSELTCRLWAPAPPGETAEPVPQRVILEPGDYFLLVDHAGFGAGGDLRLSLDTFELADNATCRTAEPLEHGSIIEEDDARLAAPATLSCVGSSPALDLNALYYRATVPARSRLTLRGPSPFHPDRGSAGRGRVQLFESCSAFTCLGEGARYTNDTRAEQEVVIAASFEDELLGTVQIEPLPATAFCDSATAINEATSATADAYLGGPPSASCLEPGAETHYFAVSIPPQTIATFQTRSEVSLTLLDGCGQDAACVGSGTTPLRFVHGGASARDLILAVSSTPGDGLGPYPGDELEVTVAFSPAPPNVSCESATRLGDGDVAMGNPSEGGSDEHPCLSGPARSLYYRVRVPAGRALRATAAATSGVYGQRGTLSILSGCEPLARCEARATFFSTEQSLFWRNEADAEEEVHVVVSRDEHSSLHGFTLEVDTVLLPENGSCAGAFRLEDAVTVTSTGHPLGGTLDYSCHDDLGTHTGTLHQVLYYFIEVPAGRAVELTHGAGPLAFALDGCEGQCLAAPRPDRLFTFNRSSDPQEVIFALGRRGDRALPLGPVPVTANLLAPPPNLSCDTPSVVDAFSVLEADLRFGGDDLSDRCLPWVDGGALYYQVTLPAGGTLSLRSAGHALQPLAFRVLDGCSAAGCLASGEYEVSYSNPSSSAPQTVLVAVSAVDPALPVEMAESFEIAIAGQPYGVSSAPAACPDLSAAPPLLSGDDLTTRELPMDSAVLVFGRSATSFVVDTNGLLYLGLDGIGLGSLPSRPDNTPLSSVPLPTSELALVAPFWDDLVLGEGDAAVRSLVLGAPGEEVFVVEWRDAHHAFEPTGLMRFQVQLHAATDVIELHYCGVTGGDPVLTSGGSATIGVRGPQAALEHAFEMVEAVRPGEALVFTPL